MSKGIFNDNIKWLLHKYVLMILKLFPCWIEAQIEPMRVETIVG
jgi:hypothetical protein